MVLAPALLVGRVLFPTIVLFGPVLASLLLFVAARHVVGWRRTLTTAAAIGGFAGALYQMWLPTLGGRLETRVLFADTLHVQLTQAGRRVVARAAHTFGLAPERLPTTWQELRPDDRVRPSDVWRIADRSKELFEAGRLDEAERIARQLLAQLPDLLADPRVYALASHDAHLVLGRIALRHGDVAEAKRRLRAAGMGPHPAQTGAVNMSLARDLLLVGERDAVRQYFRQLHANGTDEYGMLVEWDDDVREGRLPDFGFWLRI